jgi:YD repeat-containing protein
MLCPTCGYESASLQAVCPQCGSFLGAPGSSTELPKTFRYLLGGSVVLLLIMGVAAYRFRDSWNPLRANRSGSYVMISNLAVEHGGNAKPEDLEAHGKLYFVPMGAQAFPAESLAAYYTHKFKIEVSVLPKVPVGNMTYDATRHQYIAEEMILDVKRAYPRIARAKDSVVLILTDDDIYPRSLGWKFTTSFRSEGRFAVVSSRRNDPSFDSTGKPADPETKLAGVKRTISKYIGMLYFHLPVSSDPTSIMHQPLDVAPGPDDLYESDVHSEESANGLRGSGWPCLFFSYSYETHTIRNLSPVVQDCEYVPAPASVNEEIFETQLSTGEFFQFAMDFQLDSVPPIEFRRTYRSQYLPSQAFGRGSSDNYNTYLYSDGADKLTFIDIIDPTADRTHLKRLTPGKGFSPTVEFEDRDSDAEEIYKARLTWDIDHFKLKYRDGAWSTFLPCSDGRCYWTGYQDAAGHLLRFDRDASLNLKQLTASDNQGIEFASDSLFCIVSGKDTRGNHVSYEYDSGLRLVRVTRSDGQITTYSYDPGNHLTSISVSSSESGQPATVLTNEYGSSGRITRQALAGGQTFQIEYTLNSRSLRSDVTLTEPSGRVLQIKRGSDSDYNVRSTPIRFPAVMHGPRPVPQQDVAP